MSKNEGVGTAAATNRCSTLDVHVDFDATAPRLCTSQNSFAIDADRGLFGRFLGLKTVQDDQKCGSNLSPVPADGENTAVEVSDGLEGSEGQIERSTAEKAGKRRKVSFFGTGNAGHIREACRTHPDPHPGHESATVA